MDSNTNTPTPDTETSTPTRPRGLIGGAILGAAVLTASVVGISAIAGAQDEPELDTETAAVDEEVEESFEMDEESDPTWAAFDQCIDDAFSTLEAELGDIDESALTEAEMKALDERLETAAKGCDDLLPADAKAELDSFTAYDDCLAENGIKDDIGAAVFVEDGEKGQSITFGEAGGSVTITGDANGVSVTTDGDVSVLDDAFDAAEETCEQLLPEDMFDDEVEDDADDEVEDEVDED